MPARLAPTVLVVGGGFAGRAAIRYLCRTIERHVTIILCDVKPFFEFTPSILRCIAHPQHLKNITFGQYTHPDFVFLQGRVTHITVHEATVLRREHHQSTLFSVPFDYCIWATGVDYCVPIKSPSWRFNPTVSLRRGELNYSKYRIMSAKEGLRVLVIGAGPIGVELAAELTSFLVDDKSPKVTLAASPRGILPRLPKKAGQYVHTWLRRRGVHVLFARLKPGNRLPGGQFQYHNESNPSDILSPDVVFDCTGAKTNGATKALIDGGVCDSECMQPDGSLLVTDTLQLDNSPHIFIAGDASRIPRELDMNGLACEKTAYAAEEQGKLAAINVTMLMRSESLISRLPKSLRHYPVDIFPYGRFPRLFLISLYKYYGVLCIGPVTICGVIPGLLKHILEFFGVAAAEEDNIGSLTFRLLERLFYFLATMFTWMYSRPSERSVRRENGHAASSVSAGEESERLENNAGEHGRRANCQAPFSLE